eukprot:TRINITY_DN6701_c3_g2_i1.p1 TRINITY_DN6701_c3_g2~~TRINITY_DN6701_c3_g2_i1.p1  ORF type:complete len:213 (+),score=61.31 TRINITY_DN6701_c3_g2_i1:68-640(+)
MPPKEAQQKEDEPDVRMEELSSEEVAGVRTLFRFPFGIVSVAVVLGCVLGDIFMDNTLGSNDLAKYYAAQAAAGPYGTVMCSFIFLLAVVIMNFVRCGVRFHNVLSLCITLGLFAVRCTQLYPRIAALSLHLRLADPASLGRIPTALRGLFVFNLVQIPLLLLIASLQMYNYALWVTDGLGEKGGKVKKD